MKPSRRLAYDFLSLPHHKQIKIAGELGLLDEENKGLSDSELSRLIFFRAKRRNKLGNLRDLVEANDIRE